MQFHFYVLNGNFNTRKPEMYNIFNNIHVQECSEREVKKYLRAPSKYKHTSWKDDTVYGFEAFKRELQSIIMWQEWSRCEYEIEVKDPFTDDLYKWDCYQQAEPNIDIIAHEVIRQYKEQKKNK